MCGVVVLSWKKVLLIKQGNRLKYNTKSGEEVIEFRKNWTSEKLDIIMNEWNDDN